MNRSRHGSITPYNTPTNAQFHECDTNNDGYIDAYEFLTLAGRLLKEREEATGHRFDQQAYEQHVKESLAETKQLVGCCVFCCVFCCVGCGVVVRFPSVFFRSSSGCVQGLHY